MLPGRLHGKSSNLLVSALVIESVAVPNWDTSARTARMSRRAWSGGREFGVQNALANNPPQLVNIRQFARSAAASATPGGPRAPRMKRHLHTEMKSLYSMSHATSFPDALGRVSDLA